MPSAHPAIRLSSSRWPKRFADGGGERRVTHEEAIRLIQHAAEAGNTYVALQAAKLLKDSALAIPGPDVVSALQVAAAKGDPVVTHAPVAARQVPG